MQNRASGDQVGAVMNALVQSEMNENTVVIFLSDHGDFGGSHNLHTKSGALYDEAINPPLYVSFGAQRATYTIGDGSTAKLRPFLCSSVDIFPFLLTVAVGDTSWQTGTYGYIPTTREAILDMIFYPTMFQPHRYVYQGSTKLQYILHTTDEYEYPQVPSGIPNHAICFRTANAKLGMYTGWGYCDSPTPTQPTTAQTADAQYEYYDYSVATDEVSNGAVASYSGGVTTLTTGANTYLGYFNSIKAAELYTVPSRFTSGSPSVYSDALNEYLEGNGFSACSVVTTPPCSD